jgi:hypothetical protein
MSQIALSPNASGTGTFTIAAPDSNTNRTLTLPDVTTTLVGTDATQTLTNKSIAATQLTGDVAAARITTALNATGSAPIYACRAWVNFNGTNTVAIRASGNVSSITDNGVGNYTVNFTTAMQDVNYSAVAASEGPLSQTGAIGVQHCPAYIQDHAVGNVRVRFFNSANSAQAGDPIIASVAVFR